MTQTIVHVEGMHCNSCKLLLEKSIGTLDNVDSITAHVSKGTLTILHNKPINKDAIQHIVHEAGYKVVDKPIRHAWFSSNIDDYVMFFVTIVVCLVLYLFLQNFTSFSFDISTQQAPTLGMVLLIGLTAGFSTCMAVVGGLVLAVSSTWHKHNDIKTFGDKVIPHVWFNIGRIVGFGILGGVLGGLGSMLTLSPWVMSFMTLIVGGVMILLGLNLTNISPKMSAFSLSLPTSRFFSLSAIEGIQHPKKGIKKYIGAMIQGLLTFFLPCGFTFAMQLYALSTGSIWMGMVIMALFALGTLPGLIGIGSLASIFTGKYAKIAYQVIGTIVLLLGVYNISTAYDVVATKWHSFLGNTQNAIAPVSSETLIMTYTDDGISPTSLRVKAGRTYTIVIDVKTNVYGCMSTIFLNKLDENISTIKKGQKITFTITPTKTGEYKFLCAMGLYHGASVFVE